MKKKKLPFNLMPGSWGLKGKTRDLAEAEYYLEGSELEKRLVDINQPDPLWAQMEKLDIALKYHELTPAQYASQKCAVRLQLVDATQLDLLQAELDKLDIQLEHGEITPAQYATHKCAVRLQVAERDIADPVAQELAKLDIQLEYSEINPAQYAKAVACVKKEPYVNVIDIGVNPDGAVTGYLELDWNDEFVAMLQDNGYTGADDEAVVNKWFNNVCRTILLQEQADLDYGMESENAAVRTIRKD